MTPRLFLILTLAALAVAAPSAAQLPNVGDTVGGVLNPPAIRDPLGAVRETVDDVGETAVRELRRARETRLNLLRRQNPELIDVDRNGAAVIRSEVLAIAPTAEALDAARARGFTVSETLEEDTLGLTLIVLRAPQGMSTRRAVETLRDLDPQGGYDFNHIYTDGGVIDAPTAAPVSLQSRQGGGGALRIGLIDSGVDASHPALAGLSIQQRGFAGEAVAGAHGTAVASLLAGDAQNFRGAASGASLSVADVYGRRPTGGGAAAIVAALGWMAEQRATVVNVSIVGPANRALEAGVRAFIARGHVIVAAVGNDGPSAPPLYPAAYPNVIGVTGVDARDRALPEAGRGAQVDFAAPGADMAAAAQGGGFAGVRGTSFAAPIVAGLIARRMADGAAGAQADLARDARDLGARGPDRTYGAGLVGAELRVAPQRFAARR